MLARRGRHPVVLPCPILGAPIDHPDQVVGRYLAVGSGWAAARHVLHLSLATSPYCARSSQDDCAVPPGENGLRSALRAGEMTDSRPR